jgi:hypothetical protein
MLAQAVGPNLTKLLHDQLDLMFGCWLSESLRGALVAIARHIPPLLRTIQGETFGPKTQGSDNLLRDIDRLLDQLSQILSGQPYKPLGAPPSLPRHDAIIISRDYNMSKVIDRHL